MARKAPKLTIVSDTSDALDMTTPTDMTVDVAAMADALAPLEDFEHADSNQLEPVLIVLSHAPVVPSLEELRAESAEAMPDAYTLVITGSHDSLMAAGMFAGQYAKLIGAQVCVVDASGTPIRCYDPPVRGKRGDRGIGGSGVAAGPRGADWSSKSGQAVKLMMRPDGATMDEMREITGWTFGKKYVAQLMRSFGVAITTKEATARTKRTWHAVAATVTAHLDDAAEDDCHLMAAE